MKTPVVRTPGARAVASARALADELGLREPEDIDIAMIAAHCGAFARVAALEREEGHLLRAGGRAIATLDVRTLSSPKWRWVLAHELGHHRLDGAHDDFARCTMSAPAHAGVEARANDFAGEMLMPRAMFEPRWRAGAPTLARVIELASVFSTSLAAAALRALLFSDQPCAVVHTTRERVDWWCASSRAFPLSIAKGQPWGPAGREDAAREEKASVLEGVTVRWLRLT